MELKRYPAVLVISMIISMFLIVHGPAFSAERSVIIGFHQTPGPSEKALIHGARGIIKRAYKLIPAMAATLPEEAVAQLKKNKAVAYVEDDALFTAIEPLAGDEYADAWSVKHIGADIAHESGNKGAGVRVAVLDTGIDYNHEDLDDNYAGGHDFVFNDEDPFDDSWNSHGTHIAGIIAAEQNGIGVVGVAPEAELYAVKVLDGGGFGLLSWIIAGIEWAVENNMDIVNLSIQGRDSLALQDACANAYNAGVLLVAAAGNTYGGDVSFPAAYDSVIAVTGTDAFDMPAYFSPVGPELELSAPGMDILSTVAGGGYGSLSGTSQAAPHVAGTAALFLSSAPQELLNAEGLIDLTGIREKLQMEAVDLGDTGLDNTYGFGLVEASEAVLPQSWPVSMMISRTNSPPAYDAGTVQISDGRYEIMIDNNGLSRIKVDVFEDGVKMRDRSFLTGFNGNKDQIVFNINAGETDLDVVFTPLGRPGTSADISINIMEKK